jgi:hypothetical protein
VRIRSVLSHTAQAVAEGALISILVVGLMVGTAFAAKGGGGGHHSTSGGTGTISLVMVVDANGDSLPNFRDKVTFNVSTTATSQPWVTLKCYQSGSLVYKASNGIFSTSLNENFTLGPTPNWQSGAADCTAYLEDWDSYSKNGSISTLASMPVTVGA